MAVGDLVRDSSGKQWLVYNEGGSSVNLLGLNSVGGTAVMTTRPNLVSTVAAGGSPQAQTFAGRVESAIPSVPGMRDRFARALDANGTIPSAAGIPTSPNASGGRIDRATAAERMFGTGSPQHQAAIARWGTPARTASPAASAGTGNS